MYKQIARSCARLMLISGQRQILRDGMHLAAVRPIAGTSLKFHTSVQSYAQDLPPGLEDWYKTRNIDFKQLQQLIKDGGFHLIDVREKEELEQTGELPNSVHIPVSDVRAALAMPPDKYKTLYGSDRPEEDDLIVFSCQAGVRSAYAMGVAHELGFHKANNYGGGWMDWEENTSQN